MVDKMNLMQAANSGRRFKREMEEEYWDIVEKDGVQWLAYGKEQKLESMSLCWLNADDWVLEPEQEITLTRTQVLQAIRDAVKEKFAEKKIQFYQGTETVVTQCILEAANPIVKKLGFK
jgi:hypothetical protein